MYIAQIDGIFKDRDGVWIDCICKSLTLYSKP